MIFEPFHFSVPTNRTSKFQLSSFFNTPKRLLSQSSQECFSGAHICHHSPGNHISQTAVSRSTEVQKKNEKHSNYNKIRNRQQLLPAMIDSSRSKYFTSNRTKRQKLQLLTQQTEHDLLRSDKDSSVELLCGRKTYNLEKGDEIIQSPHQINNIPSRMRLGAQFEKLQKQQANSIKGRLIKQLTQQNTPNYSQFSSERNICKVQPPLQTLKSSLYQSQRKIIIPEEKKHSEIQIESAKDQRYKSYEHLMNAPKGFVKMKDIEVQEIRVQIPKLDSKLEKFQNYNMNVNMNEMRDRSKLSQIIRKNIEKLKKLKKIQIDDVFAFQIWLKDYQLIGFQFKAFRKRKFKRINSCCEEELSRQGEGTTESKQVSNV